MRVVHYLNQFYAGKGGEDKADWKPEAAPGPVGPGLELKKLFGDQAEVVGTVICGDSHYGENMEAAQAEVIKLIESFRPDVLIAGPAFNAGRYGVACGNVCQGAAEKLGLPAVSGMYNENPGLELYRKYAYIVSTPDSARGMRAALSKMAALALKLGRKEAMASAADEGYFSRGIRKNFFRPVNGAERAVEMALARLRGQPFKTEYEMPVFKRIAPAAPLTDLKTAVIALITSGGVVPRGNPDHIRVSSAETFGAYDISGVTDMKPEDYESIHGGYDRYWAGVDPDVIVPLDVMREMEREGVFGKLHDTFYATTGTGTSVAHAERFGQEIGEKLRKAGVSAAILTST
jgi:glycine reductase